MSERWVLIQLDERETLKCSSCGTYLYFQKVHLHLNDEIEEIMCDVCWKNKKAIKLMDAEEGMKK